MSAGKAALLPQPLLPSTTNVVEKKKKKLKKQEMYSCYLRKVLREIHPDISISTTAMSVMNSFMNDIFEKIATEASTLAKNSKRKTIRGHDIQTAVRFMCPGELGTHAIRTGSKAVAKYKASADEHF